MGQKIADLRKSVDEGNPAETLQNCCSCAEDPRPSSAGPSTVKAVYSADRDHEDTNPKLPGRGQNVVIKSVAQPGSLVKHLTPINHRVVHTDDEIRIEQQTQEELAELNAEATFQILRDDWTDEAMMDLTQVLGKLALSKERVKVVLQHTQDKRFTCAQLNELLKTVALETHKEQVLFERYSHLIDKKNFETEVINAFTLSKSIRGSLKRKLTKSLTAKPQVLDSDEVFDTTV